MLSQRKAHDAEGLLNLLDLLNLNIVIGFWEQGICNRENLAFERRGEFLSKSSFSKDNRELPIFQVESRSSTSSQTQKQPAPLHSIQP